MEQDEKEKSVEVTEEVEESSDLTSQAAEASEAVAEEQEPVAESAQASAAEEAEPQQAATESDEQDEDESEQEDEGPRQLTAEDFQDDDTYKWYVVRTYSGYEQKAKLALQERIKQHKMHENFREILVPSENVIELVRGEKKTTSRKFFPGYMLVKMALSDTTWHLVKGTPKVTGFVGNATKPPSVPPEEVATIATQMQEGTLKPRPKVQFTEGENVRVVDGPFVNFSGVVEEVKPEKGKLRVMVSIFGRSTPVELDFVQVEKN